MGRKKKEPKETEDWVDEPQTSVEKKSEELEKEKPSVLNVPGKFRKFL